MYNDSPTAISVYASSQDEFVRRALALVKHYSARGYKVLGALAIGSGYREIILSY